AGTHDLHDRPSPEHAHEMRCAAGDRKRKTRRRGPGGVNGRRRWPWASMGDAMSLTVSVLANTFSYPQGGGHLWVYLNWALGLRSLGCQVIWLEDTDPRLPTCEVQRLVAALKARLARYDLADAVALCSARPEPLPREAAAGGW